MNIKEAYQQRMNAQWGHLVDYWYPLIEVKTLDKKSITKVQAFNVNYLVWKNEQGKVSVFLDTCIHKQSPLSVGHLAKETLTCPYHGWQFDHQGICTNIPYSNDPSDCSNKQLLTIPSKVEGQLVWFFPNGNTPNAEINKSTQPHWQYLPKDLIKTEVFECNEQALIENFMDSPHTNFIHSGLIRKQQKLKVRDIAIYLDKQQTLYVDHLPSKESLGPFNWFINPQNNPIHHQDIFVTPAHVDIQYQFEKNKTNFRTQISICPIDPHTTRAFFKVSSQFKRFNPIIRFGLKCFLPIILKQDKKIVALQAKNLSKLTHFNGQFIPYDIYSYQVKLLREQAKNKQAAHGLLTSIHQTSLKL